jgi:hypothetical protein
LEELYSGRTIKKEWNAHALRQATRETCDADGVSIGVNRRYMLGHNFEFGDVVDVLEDFLTLIGMVRITISHLTD